MFLLLEQGDSNKRDTAFVSFLAVGRYRFAALPGGKGRVFFGALPERKRPGPGVVVVVIFVVHYYFQLLF